MLFDFSVTSELSLCVGDRSIALLCFSFFSGGHTGSIAPIQIAWDWVAFLLSTDFDSPLSPMLALLYQLHCFSSPLPKLGG